MAKRIIGILIVVLGLGVAGVFAGAMWLNQAPNAVDTRISFSIGAGENLDAIANRLEQAGAIKSAFFLKLYARLRGTQSSFRQGNYAFSSLSSMVQVHDLLVSGVQLNIKVTFPEGSTLRQMALLLEEKRICKAADFLAAAKDPAVLAKAGLPGKTAEGYLFPDTYLFPEDYPTQAVLLHMIENWKIQMDGVFPAWRTMDSEKLRRALIIASIVEREYLVPAEAPLMASVFFNRLAMRKPLESCATVVYVMTEELGLKHPSRLYYRDLARKSDYNTYLHAGLPPGPISNPGRAALAGAFKPAETDYLFFVLKGADASRHHFSKTFAEHNQATVFYLKGQG